MKIRLRAIVRCKLELSGHHGAWTQGQAVAVALRAKLLCGLNSLFPHESVTVFATAAHAIHVRT